MILRSRLLCSAGAALTLIMTPTAASADTVSYDCVFDTNGGRLTVQLAVDFDARTVSAIWPDGVRHVAKEAYPNQEDPSVYMTEFDTGSRDYGISFPVEGGESSYVGDYGFEFGKGMCRR